MRLKVELHRDVVWFLRHRCSEAEVDAFYVHLEIVRTEPIANSEAVADPALSRYMLRFFRFADCIAIFQYRPAEDRIIVRQCRRIRPRRGRRQTPNDGPRGP
jgi:hypothetical protein